MTVAITVLSLWLGLSLAYKKRHISILNSTAIKKQEEEEVVEEELFI